MKNIHIPTIDELMTPDRAYGILFGDEDGLKYLNLETKTTITLRRMNLDIYAVFATKEKIFIGGSDTVIGPLFDKQEIQRIRANKINCIYEFNEGLLDAGGYGLFNTLEDKAVISEKEMNSKDVVCISSLASDNQNNLYCLVQNKDSRHSFARKDSLEQPIIRYNTRHTMLCQAIIIPYGSLKGLDGKEYPFSVISCAHLQCLDINGEKIKGTAVDSGQIKRIALLKQYGSTIEIAYSGIKLIDVTKATINLDKKKVLQKEPILKDLHNGPLALHPVKNLSLHQKLIQGGRQ